MPASDRLAAMRQSYTAAALDSGDLAPTWLAMLARWLDEAVAAELTEPNAMVLATVDGGGRVTSRTVLLKGLDDRGLVLYTNYGSTKALAVESNRNVAITFPWYDLQRQVQVVGTAEPISAGVSAEYFATRPRGSQLGAWASPQSQPVHDRAALESRLAEVQRRFPDEVPMPPHWGGLRVVPDSVEFWQGRENRLHDRLRYRRFGESWVTERLAP